MTKKRLNIDEMMGNIAKKHGVSVEELGEKLKEKAKNFSTGRIAVRIGEMAQELGKQYTTDDPELAELIAMTLAEMVAAKSEEHVRLVVKAIIDTREETREWPDSWGYLCLVTNWLSWAWHEEGDKELAKAWSDAWYKINAYTIDNMTGKRLEEYQEYVD